MITLIYRPKRNNFWHCEQKREVSMQYLVNNYNIDAKITILDQQRNDISDEFFVNIKSHGANECEFCGKLFMQHRTSLDPDNTVCGSCNVTVLKDACELEYMSHRECRTCGKQLRKDRYFECFQCLTPLNMQYQIDMTGISEFHVVDNKKNPDTRVPHKPEGIKKSLGDLTRQVKREKLLLSKQTTKEKRKWHW